MVSLCRKTFLENNTVFTRYVLSVVVNILEPRIFAPFCSISIQELYLFIIKYLCMRNVQSTLLYQWFENVWNREDKDALHSLLTKEVRVHGLVSDAPVEGAPGFAMFYDNFKTQFHNINVEIDDVISQDDMEAARTTVHAIHTESKKDVHFTGICMVKIENGKIAEAWNEFDFLSMYQQLGQNLIA